MNGNSDTFAARLGNWRQAVVQPVVLVLRTLLLLATITGCTQYWAKPGGTPAEFEATKATCESQSYAEYPPIPQQVMLTAGYTTPLQTTCTGAGWTTNCFTTGGQYYPPSYITVDSNLGARNSAVKACLYAAGWQPVKDRAEAVAVTQSGIAASISGGSSPATISTEAAQSATRYCDNIFKIKQDRGMMAAFDNSYDECYQTRAREIQSLR